jgi:hypothetical protein
MCHSLFIFILDTVVLSKVLSLNYYLHKNCEICNCFIHALRCCCLLNLIIRHTIAIFCTFFLTLYYNSIQGPSHKVLKFIEYRAVSGVFRAIDPPPHPLSP